MGDIDFEEQLRQQELEKQADHKVERTGDTYTDKDGTVYEWDHKQKAYVPKVREMCLLDLLFMTILKTNTFYRLMIIKVKVFLISIWTCTKSVFITLDSTGDVYRGIWVGENQIISLATLLNCHMNLVF